MTSMEKAFVALVEVLCNRLREQDDELTKLRQDSIELRSVKWDRDRLKIHEGELERDLMVARRRGDELYEELRLLRLQLGKKRTRRPSGSA
jgi:hypothetical protein